MTLARRLQPRWFPPSTHPYRILERRAAQLLGPGARVLDAGCGRSAEVLRRLAGTAAEATGVDVVDLLPEAASGIRFVRSSLEQVPLEAASQDLIVSRSVMEHLENPLAVYREMHRLLQPGGHFVFLTPNLWDYASLISRIVPNRWHPALVHSLTGRDEADTFPAYYRSNTKGKIRRLARESGFEVVTLEYHGQYPDYLMFNSALFVAGSAYEKVISNVPPLRCLQGWILAVLRKEES